MAKRAQRHGDLWPANAIEWRPIDALHAYANNARLHSDEQVAQIAESIQKWGWTIPVLIDEDNEIIAGHGRVDAARRIGIDTVPCMVAKGWSKEQQRAYVIADNKLAQNASWDMDLLRVEMADLEAMGLPPELIGFTAAEFDTLINGWSYEMQSRDIAGEHELDAAVVKLKCRISEAAALKDALRTWLDSGEYAHVTVS